MGRTRLLGKTLRRGEKLTPRGKGWRLVSPGRKRAFKATLIGNFSVGDERVALFRVLIPQ